MLEHKDYCVGTYQDIVYDEIGERSAMQWRVDDFGRPTFPFAPHVDPWKELAHAQYHCDRCNYNFSGWPEVMAHWAAMPDDEVPEPE